ncbi:MAG: hypothetical protein J6W10_06280, partial [Kiritimatiellae bacterium]|nr:hypothetical protein [Kiritimatiellia bacterium]
MMSVRKEVIALATMLGVCTRLFAVTGDCYKNAASISVGSTKTVTLVDEKNLDYDSSFDDPEDKTYGTGAYYLKFIASRGKAYTVTVKRNSPDADLTAEIYDKSEWDWEAEVTWPGFNSEIDPDGMTDRYIIAEDDWTLPDSEFGEEFSDDKSVTCYIYISSETIGEQAVVSVESGVVEYQPPLGSELKPYSITVSSSEKKYAGKLVDDGMFYFNTQSLTKGNKYKFWTSGGTEDASLDVDVA